jgi:hypothetical protein
MGLIKTYVSFDGDDMTQNRVQDVEPILDACAALRSIGAVGSREMKHAAKLPNVLVEDYINIHGITPHEFEVNPEHLRRLLNSSAFASFRIWQGKV